MSKRVAVTSHEDEFMSPQAAKKRQTLRTPVTGKNERTPIISPYKPFDAAANTGTENPITFNDPIHGIIELHPLEKRIIDTPQFQRLDDLKQLGASNYVFRGATHTRFEHSIGVAHLAEKVVDILRKNLPESGVKITDKDTLCVKIAGLCHDLGHGPFSHVFDAVFIPRVWPKGIDGNGGEWRHEDGSVRMLNHLLETNGINLTSFGLEEQDKLFIEEIISGTDEKVRKGRKPEKFFLYDIVNNCRSGLDVDKLDYFKRDQQYANVALQTDFTRIIDFGRVMPADPIKTDKRGNPLANFGNARVNMICYPEKMIHEALNVFGVRFKMHDLVYQNKAVKSIEYMLTDALVAADDYIRLEGSKTARNPDGKYKLSECIFDMAAMSNLQDSVKYLIASDPRPELKPAKEILNRIKTRNLYSCVGFVRMKLDKYKTLNKDEIAEELVRISENFAPWEHASDSHAPLAFSCNYNAEDGPDHVNLSSTPENHDTCNTMNNEEDGDDHSDSGMESEDDMFNLSQTVSQKKRPVRTVSNAPQTSRSAPGTHTTLDSYTYNDVSNGGLYKGSCDFDKFSQPANVHIEQTSGPLEKCDLIVEKMHIHYGMKEQNPLSRLRFYAKNDGVGREVDPETYEHITPSSFEVFNIRVFVRDRAKKAVAHRAFQEWSQQHKTMQPFPTLSQDVASPYLSQY